jgi:NAD-dependent aldehyde dehydrogenases
MSNSGQSCDAPTRMLVEKSIYERAVKEASDEANKIKVDVDFKKRRSHRSCSFKNSIR